MIAIIIKPKFVLAEADNTNWGLDNYRYHAKTKSNNCFIMHIPELSSAMTKLLKLLVSALCDVTSACKKLHQQVIWQDAAPHNSLKAACSA